MQRGVLGVDVIALLAIVGAVALGEHLAAIIIALMVAGGSALDEFAEARARHELATLVGRTPHIAHRHEADHVADVPVASISPNDLLLIKPGEILPVDGMVETEAAMLDKSALTGEPVPLMRAHSDPVRSGVVNAGGPFSIRATATAEHGARYAAVVRLVDAAERERPPLVRLADRWAIGFLAATLLLGGGAWWFAADATRALAVLVVATPCPLILAAPVALICGVSRAARRGIIVKGGGVLERLAPYARCFRQDRHTHDWDILVSPASRHWTGSIQMTCCDALPHWHRYRSTLWPAPSSPRRAPSTFRSLCRMTQKRFLVAAWSAMWMASNSC